MSRMLCVFAFTIFGLICSIDAQSVQKICQNDGQCDEGYCCILGNYENSFPQCQPRQKEGDSCRPFEELLTNQTHYFMNEMKKETQIELKGVHTAVCPCLSALFCDKNDGVCVDLDTS